MSAVTSLVALSLLVAGVNPDAELSTVNDAPAATPATTTIHQGDWTESLDEARRISAEKNIPVILHFEASWCGACRRMDKQVLGASAVKEYLGERVIGVRVDADRHRSLIDQYQVATLPTEIVIAPDGTEGARYVGAVSLQSYLSRLEAVAGQTVSVAADSDKKPETDATPQDTRTEGATEKTRSCLIVHRDGKMVGLGGFSPVALADNRKWQPGKEEFVVSFQDVEYFLQSADEVTRFEADPENFVPHLHGCDPVELHRSKLARIGAIEFGAFYKGEMFFFASLQNRTRFQNNPTWYLGSDQQPESDSEAAQLLDMIR